MAFKYNARDNTNSRVGKETTNPTRITMHHVPPKCPDKEPRVIKVQQKHHRAYHILFGNPKSLEDAIFILKRDWFP